MKTRAAVAREAAKASARPRTRARLGSRKPRKEEVIVISERESEEKKVEEEPPEQEEEEEEEKGKAVMGDESGGLSANKAAGQEDEGNTVPFPEKVFTFVLFVSMFFESLLYLLCGGVFSFLFFSFF